MPRQANEWERRFGAKRRAADRALLKALEQQIVAEELEAARKALLEDPKVKIGARVKADYDAENAPVHQIDEPMRQRIAEAFGKPVASEELRAWVGKFMVNDVKPDVNELLSEFQRERGR